MGMTIKDAIFHLGTWSTTHGSGMTTDEQHEQAKKIARDIMRKYQKIEEIINAEVDPYICNNFGDVRKVQAIREVLEEGNE